MVTSAEGSAGTPDALGDEQFRKEFQRRSKRFARRYYPFGIGAAFLAVVVGVLPSTLPSNSLGFVPTLPARHLSVASPAASTLPTNPPGAVATTPGSPLFAESAGSSPLVTSSAPVAAGNVTTPAPTAASGGGTPAGNELSCDLPLPKEPPAPPAADLLEAFAVAGPFGADAVAGAGFLAPVLPLVTPLLPLAGALTGKNGAALSQLLATIGNDENALLAPVAPYISAGNQTTLSFDQKLLTAFGPVLHLAEDLPDLDCVGVLEIETASTIDPSGYPGATSLLGTVSPTDADTHVVAFSATWAQGVTPSLQTAMDELVASGVPVELHLVDSVPSGHQRDTAGFASWVTSVMFENPKVAIFEIDPSRSPSGAPADGRSSLADGLDAAAVARSAGQLVGMGLPVPLATAPWWSQLAAQLQPGVLGHLNFLGVDASPLGARVSPESLRWMLDELRSGVLQRDGLSSTMPFFVTIGSATGATATEAGAYARALSGLGVGLLSLLTPVDANAGAIPSTILSALLRTPAPK